VPLLERTWRTEYQQPPPPEGFETISG
jgi:hypothetical protein